MRRRRSAPPRWRRLLRGAARRPSRKLINTCYSLVAPDYGISVAGVYRPPNGLLADVEGAGGVSPLDAPPRVPRRSRRTMPRPGSRRSRPKSSAERLPALARSCARRRRSPRAAAGLRPMRSRRRRDPGLADRRARRSGARPRHRRRPAEGLCLLCHSGPVPGAAVPGRPRARPRRRRRAADRGPAPAAASSTAGRLNPETIMPSYYRIEGSTAGRPAWRGKPMLGGAGDRGRGRLSRRPCAEERRAGPDDAGEHAR